MGKVTGFMEFDRIEEGYAPVAERLKNYKEFVLTLSDSQAKVQGARCNTPRSCRQPVLAPRSLSTR